MSSRAIRGPSPLVGLVVLLANVEGVAASVPRLLFAAACLGLVGLSSTCLRNQRRRVSSETSTPIFESASTIVRSEAPAARSRINPARSRSRSAPLVFVADRASATRSENLRESFAWELAIVRRICGNHVAAVWHKQAVDAAIRWKNLSARRLDVGVLNSFLSLSLPSWVESEVKSCGSVSGVSSQNEGAKR